MSVRLIDADALIRTACEKFYTTNYYSHILEMIDNAPTIEPRTGEWVKFINEYGLEETKCSVCGENFTTYDTYGWNYCYNCGAKMKGADDE